MVRPNPSPSSIIHHPLSIIHRPSSIVHRPSSIVHRPRPRTLWSALHGAAVGPGPNRTLREGGADTLSAPAPVLHHRCLRSSTRCRWCTTSRASPSCCRTRSRASTSTRRSRRRSRRRRRSSRPTEPWRRRRLRRVSRAAKEMASWWIRQGSVISLVPFSGATWVCVVRDPSSGHQLLSPAR